VREVLELGAGAVVELDRSYADPVDLSVNGCVVARGEVVVAGDRLGIRVTQILSAGVDTES
jgi:flagellar motor switch protein FliN/FliY